MATTKTTTRISVARAGIAVLGLFLASFAVINLFLTMTPTAKLGTEIDAEFQNALALRGEEKREAFRQLENEQTAILARRPSDPYGWARLSYLRLETKGDQQTAFSALAMSDTISPYEAAELPERAVMWSRFRNVENADQQAYQDVLWRKAYSLEPDLTWQTAVSNHLVNEAGESLKKTDSALYGFWTARESSQH